MSIHHISIEGKPIQMIWRTYQTALRQGSINGREITAVRDELEGMMCLDCARQYSEEPEALFVEDHRKFRCASCGETVQ